MASPYDGPRDLSSEDWYDNTRTILSDIDRLGGERTKKFFEDAYDFVTAKVGGEQYILSAVVHMDEATPTLLLTARV